jgi:hypothetical protein
MTAAFGRRLDKVEAQLVPSPTSVFRLLQEPRPSAGQGVKDQFQSEINAGKSAGEIVLVVRFEDPKSRVCRPNEVIDGVEYFDKAWQASVAMLARQPSKKGLKSALDDVLKGAMGKVYGVVANAGQFDG